MTAQPTGRAGFTTTHWSVVLAAQADSTPKARAALTQLCERYWYPLYAYLRRSGYGADDAQDLTQAFFAHILEKRTFWKADPERGRFRSFLLASLKNFVSNERSRARAAKRGGSSPSMSLELDTAEGRYRVEPASDETPERVFDRRWALALLDRVLGMLRAEYGTGHKDAVFDQLKMYPARQKTDVGYKDVGERLAMTEGAVKVAVHRLRKRFRDMLREEIAQTVASPGEIEDEIHHLKAAVGR